MQDLLLYANTIPDTMEYLVQDIVLGYIARDSTWSILDLNKAINVANLWKDKLQESRDLLNPDAHAAV